MSLRDDIAAMERHEINGTLAQWIDGTAKPLPLDPLPADRSIGKQGYAWIRERGE